MTIVPEPLAAGDLVGVAAPAGYLEQRERYLQGCAIIREMGFEIFEEKKTWPGYGYLADHDEARAAELHRLFAHPDVKAIISLRGGFGCLRLLDKLDTALIGRHPKLFVGFSDITVLHNHFCTAAGFICLHGPGLAALALNDQPSRERFFYCLRGEWHRRLSEDVEIVRGGEQASGRLMGGNLSSLATLLGTPWFPDLNEAILLLEDVNEPLYRLDRLLTQIWLSGRVDRLCGVILGQFSDDDTNGLERLRRSEFVWRRVAELTARSGIPLWGNFPVGHGCRNLTVPLGARCIMNSATGELLFPGEQHGD